MTNQMFETPFLEEQFHVPNLGAHVHEGTVSSGSTPPLPAPIGVIRTDQDWSVHVYWRTEGNLVPILRGIWHLDLYLERMGPGPDLRLPLSDGLDLPLAPASSPVDYNEFINVAAGTVPIPASDHPVVYKLVTTITYKYCSKGKFGLMAGFVEGPMIQFYTP